MTEKFAIESSENIIKARRLVVRTTNGDVEPFDSKKIIHSLISETTINENVAHKVTDMVLKRIINANIQWLSGPAIREMCCSVLAEIGLLEARKRYTRIGMPLMDYENFIEIGIKENANQYQNPMSIHSWCADRISSEYSLLRLLTEKQSKAHLKGDIHIHMLPYFDLRPFCQEFDLRIILKNGLPPVNWPYSAVSKPAKHPIVAFLHAAKWLGLITGEFSGGLGYDNFTVFLAPYLKGLSEKEIEQMAQSFVFESNQIYASRGGQIPFTSISCVPTIPDNLRDVQAVSFEGKYDGVYGDYLDECNALFKALSKVYFKGDGIGRLFNFPKHEIKLKKEWIREFEEDYLLISEETAKFGNPYYLNLVADWMPDEVHSQCCRLILTPEGIRKICDDPELFDWSKSYINLGSLQSVSLNLPRYAYISKGKEDKFFEILDDYMLLIRDILLIKRKLIGKRLESGLLPLSSRQVDDGTRLLDLRKQSVNIGFVGLNECVLSITNHELHENKEAFILGKKILKHMAKKCDEFTTENSFKFSLWEQPAESTSGRFAYLDLKHYPNKAIVQGNPELNAVYYTNSDHLRYSADIPLFERIQKQSEFHPIVQGGVITHVWLGESYPDPEGLWKLTKKIAFNTPTAYWAYTKDFTQCLECQKFLNGIYTACPQCGASSEKLEWWSRITGYYSRLTGWNASKIEEWKSRKRYNFNKMQKPE
ncbi:MAG: anaerobic ribonucleoside-triphosphate reductase [Candidatus Helarchaeota archaeon]|nr:anaerobic ribonucleoside-triphosphate reductase [Candidatus Helarchaeota archaeon]